MKYNNIVARILNPVKTVTYVLPGMYAAEIILLLLIR